MPRIDEYRCVRLDYGANRLPAAGEMLLHQGGDGEAFLAAFCCPCGCDKVLGLPVDRTHHGHCWGLSVDTEDRPTLTPSVQSLDGCKSHYFIRDGKVEWC